MGEEPLAGQWVGPMPVKSFIEGFLETNPATLSRMPGFRSDPFDCLDKEEDEETMCDTFIRVVETSLALPGFKLVNTSSKSDINGMNGKKKQPAISCYESGIDLSSSLVNYEEMELIIELNPYKQSADPFDDKGKAGEGVVHPFEPISNKSDNVHCAREKCRGLLASYARVWSSRQHRTHCFLLWLGDPDARIVRMDRSGGIVSAAFNYRTEGHFLLQFLWRFSQSTPEARGRDTTVANASPEEAEKATKILKEARFIPSSDRSVLRAQVPDAKQKTKSRSFLVWGPLADPRSATGRATRGYPAVDPLGNNGQGSIVFLKDSWRSCEEGMEKESAILDSLNEKHCQNVPEFICGDDLDQFTVTKTFAKEHWNIGADPEDLVDRVHTRFTQKEVGYHLEGFKSSKEFLQAVYDAFLAHKDAYELCGILHRDISAGNILMRKNGSGGGFLNDWDLAKRVDKDVIARQPFRSGTWQFMSAGLLGKPDKHVRKIMLSIFDEEHDDEPGKPMCGGWGKKNVCTPGRGQIGIAFAISGNKPLTFWLRKMLELWEQWYRLVYGHDSAVLDAEELLDLSHEEAMKLHPFDDRSSAMRNHDAAISIFKTVLDMTTWPISDKALDALSSHSQVKRERGSEANTEQKSPGAVENPTEEAASTKPAKRVKTSEKPKDEDDDAY